MIDYLNIGVNSIDDYPRFCPSPHTGSLNPYQQVYVDNAGDITTLTIVSTNLGEPQHSTLSFQTGIWQSVPQLYALDPGLDFLVVSTTQGIIYFQIKGVQVSMSHKAPVDAIANRLIITQPVALTPVEAMPTAPTPHAKTTEAEPASSPTRSNDHRATHRPSTEHLVKKFCTQCGAPFQPQDKYCAYCSHRLEAID